MLTVAIALAAKVFEGKRDKSGKPYILHPLHVMNSLNTDDEELQIIAILHDVPEDCDEGIEPMLEILRDMGFSLRVLIAVDLLSHRSGVDYMEYIKGIAFNEDAKAVKKADLEHNSNITRLKGVRQKDFARMQKYNTAYVYLTD